MVIHIKKKYLVPCNIIMEDQSTKCVIFYLVMVLKLISTTKQLLFNPICKPNETICVLQHLVLVKYNIFFFALRESLAKIISSGRKKNCK